MKLSGQSAPQSCDCRQPAARTQTRTSKDSSALKLTLKTAEGDTVEISLEAQSLRQSERASASGPGGRISPIPLKLFAILSIELNKISIWSPLECAPHGR